MNFYEEMIGGLDLKWAIENGWAVPPKCKLAQVHSLDLSKIKIVGGDFAQKELADEMNKEANLQRLCLITAEEMEGQTVLFTASVASAKGAAHYLNNNYNIPAVYVYGTQPDDERNEALRQFKSGEARVLCNCQVVAVGFDFPPTQTLVLGRPTKSRSFWLQCVGRATRPLAGVVDGAGSTQDRIAAIAGSSKPHFKIVDCTSGSMDHTVVTAVDMFCVATAETKEAVCKAATGKPLTAEELQAIADAEAAKAEERRRQEEERRAAAQMIESMRKNTQGRASGVVSSRDLDITWKGVRSVGTYMNPLKGKYGGLKMSQLPDYYIRWACHNQGIRGWIKTMFLKEMARRKNETAQAS